MWRFSDADLKYKNFVLVRMIYSAAHHAGLSFVWRNQVHRDLSVLKWTD